MIVKAELEKLQLHYTSVELGEANIEDVPTAEQLTRLASGLQIFGLELIDEKRSVLVENIKNVVIQMVHHSTELPRINFSVFISNKLGYDYNYLSNLFSESQAITIEQFVILHKIERVKEMLVHSNMSLTKIAAVMQYSSAAHLANQFKKITGITSTQFRKTKSGMRVNLEDI
jgi:YesN/AraC family two-component response regulator